jgi:hypothetical protein
VLAAPRRLADHDIVLMPVALAADGGLLLTQFCHSDDFRLGLVARETAPVTAAFDRNVIHRVSYRRRREMPPRRGMERSMSSDHTWGGKKYGLRMVGSCSLAVRSQSTGRR